MVAAKLPDCVRSGRSPKFPSNKAGFFLRCSQLLLGVGGRETGSNASHLKILQPGGACGGCVFGVMSCRGKAIKLRIGKMEQQRRTLNILNFSCGFDVNTSWSCVYTNVAVIKNRSGNDFYILMFLRYTAFGIFGKGLKFCAFCWVDFQMNADESSEFWQPPLWPMGQVMALAGLQRVSKENWAGEARGRSSHGNFYSKSELCIAFAGEL